MHEKYLVLINFKVRLTFVIFFFFPFLQTPIFYLSKNNNLSLYQKYETLFPLNVSQQSIHIEIYKYKCWIISEESMLFCVFLVLCMFVRLSLTLLISNCIDGYGY